MTDLSHLGKVDKSTLQYADQLERTKYWFERSDLSLGARLFTNPERYQLDFESKSDTKGEDYDCETDTRLQTTSDNR